MEIRDATAMDLDAIRRLVAEVGREFGFEPEPLGADLDLYGEADAYFRSSALLEVIEHDGNVVGVLGVVQVSARVWELRKLYLAPAHRSGGHGRALANRAIAFARGQSASKLVLQSSVKLTAALALYRSLGFAEVEGEPHSDTCDVAMELLLGGEYGAVSR